MSVEFTYYDKQPEKLRPKLVEYHDPLEDVMPRSSQLTYTLEFDVDAYQSLNNLPPEEYHQRIEALNGTTEFNLITTLGERLNAAVSRRIDRLGEDGIMRDIHQGRALIDWYEAGRLARVEQGSSQHDQLREKAEVIGQQKIQERMAEAPVGTMIFYMSRPGNENLPPETPCFERSIYEHNFMDIAYKISETEIEVTRSMSGLSMEETLAVIKMLRPDHQFQENVDDITLLENPIELLLGENIIKTPEDLQGFVYRNLENSLTEEEFEIVKRECMPYIKRYLMIVENCLGVTPMLKSSYNAVVNKADEVVHGLKRGIYTYQTKSEDSVASFYQVAFFGSLPVRAVSTGCGFSGGFANTENNTPFGVLDFSRKPPDEKDSKGSLFFACPRCKHVNKRPREGFLELCQRCLGSVRCDGSESDELTKKRMMKQKVEAKWLPKQAVKETANKKQVTEGILVTLFSLFETKEIDRGN